MRKGTRTSPAAFIGSAAVMAVALTVVYLFFVRTTDGQRVDELAFDGAEIGQRTIEPLALNLLDALPTVAVAIALVAAIIVTLVRRNWHVLFMGVAAALAANVTTQILKASFLARPDLGIDTFEINSLPSGHTTVAASAALVVFLVSSRKFRPAAAFIGATFTVIAGTATLSSQWHRPSDVIASLLVVAFWGCIAGAILVRTRYGRATARAPRTGALLWIALPCAIATGLAFVSAYLMPAGDQTSLLVGYAGGVTAIVAIGFLLAVAAIRLFRRVS